MLFRVVVALVGAILLWSASCKAAEVVLIPASVNEPTMIVVRGRLDAGDERDFIKAALAVDQAIVRFDSEGGDLKAGMEIGKAIRLKEFSTLVARETYCASACALAWLGGVKRFMEPGSRIGFHAAYTVQNGESRESGVGNALVGAYLARLGLASEAITYITTAAPESMQWLTAADANQYGIEVALIKSKSTSEGAQTTDLNKPSKSTTTSEPEPWLVQNGIDLFGFDLDAKPSATGSASECETQCRQHLRCAAYTFNKKNSACFLKYHADTIYRNEHALSGFRAHLARQFKQSPFIIYEDQDLPGSDFIQQNPVSFSNCIAACLYNPRCNSFSYLSRKKQCWLKTQAGVSTSKLGVTSGVRDSTSIEKSTSGNKKYFYDRISNEP